MALTTRCPQCGTSFKVVPDQLRVRNGLVRCGACSTVFDGRACLLPESGAPTTLPPAPAAKPATPPAAAAAVAAPVLATRAAPPAPPAPPAYVPPPLSRPSAEPREIAPWEDEPVSPAPQAVSPPPQPVRPAPAAPVVSPAVPPAVLRGREAIRRRDEPDTHLPEDDADDEDASEDDSAYRPSPSRNEPVFAPPATEPVIDWDARRHAAADTRHSHDKLDADDDRGHHIRITDYDDEPEPDDGREPVLGDTRTRYSSATDVGRTPPEFLDQDRQERRGLFRKLWGYACLLGLIALGLQLLYAYRTDIANSVPVMRPVLETVCKPLGCTVGYARRLERIAISSSSLQPPTGAAAIDDGRSRLVLNLVLRNRYDKPQHWPALVLDLTDLSDTVVVRKVLRPENYLTPEQLRGPFGPAGELKISVPIEVTGVQVNGYQLDKFFP
ncbi:DUF3426 domain-containing protein [Achromobacter sp. NPDC008082]|jgi:predicted Zn finger-like uncharacterized protein|uniref:DUF3426 domain-containing protein n=1 Tax=Achromobacter sp. NPDC008082 TaxID=3363888 RepID=UPI0036EECBDC